MKNQIKLIAALTVGVTFANTAGTLEAGRPFGRFSNQSSRSSQNYSNRNYSAANRAPVRTQQPSSATSYASSILQSPERMEKVYGPSILVRDIPVSTKPVVAQP
ncbi:hypothetical protein LF1_01500 [Rubripirellula obstinata]|uniref:Uncharacterized protein n=2 Tax=Rubripirellula obstinata TaxID=406547 RepID=A0A5B1CBS1_9BACT|nr:hypothetical protein [Rubripirellula obstinata]KAA1257662.1 hypothetical protein LF1_01500 [Rubripirellula obstinata]